jgi:hypothetical protein
MFGDNELTHYDKQAILYFKDHFKTADMMEDLKVFVGHQYALDVNQVEHYSIYNFVVKLYFKLINLGVINISYEDFVLKLFGYEKSIDYIGMIKKLRSEIANTETKKLNIGDADYTLLPKYECEKTEDYFAEEFMEVSNEALEEEFESQ